MISKQTKLLVIIAGASLAGTASAQELMIFPNEGQDKQQQEQDEFACYSWAKGETGFDPMAVPTATKPPPQETDTSGQMARGAVRGAAIGGIVGNSDDAKKGAAAGAAVGGMRRRDQKRKDDQARAQWEQEQQQIYAENRSRYNRAFAACMEAKDYTVR